MKEWMGRYGWDDQIWENLFVRIKRVDAGKCTDDDIRSILSP